MTLHTGVFLLSVIGTPFLCLAQDNAWERLRQVSPGRKVEVRQVSGEAITGKFESLSDREIKVMRGDGKAMAVPRDSVNTVALVIGKSRGKKAAIGAGITAGALGGIFAAACASGGCDDEYFALGALISIPFWSGVAGGISALFPPHKEVIYAAPMGSGMRTTAMDQTRSTPGSGEATAAVAPKPASKKFWPFRR